MNILDLPVSMVEQVLECLSYDEIAKKRVVCKKFDKICQGLLNRGFTKMIKRHNTNLKAIKAQLPRRESERRNHPLAKHSDILTCIETRISMLSMTYSKYIELDLCCFIPGKVIDEVLTILRLVENTTRPLRAHEVLQELRDISSMAIEHFDEHIANRIKKHITHRQGIKLSGFIQSEVILPCEVNGEKLVLPTLRPTSPPMPSPPSQPTFQRHKARSHSSTDSLVSKLGHKTNKLRLAMNKMVAVLHSYKNSMRQIKTQVSRQNSDIKELRRRLEETEVKNRELSANISQMKCDSGASTSKAVSTTDSTAKIILKRVTDVPLSISAAKTTESSDSSATDAQYFPDAKRMKISSD